MQSDFAKLPLATLDRAAYSVSAAQQPVASATTSVDGADASTERAHCEVRENRKEISSMSLVITSVQPNCLQGDFDLFQRTAVSEFQVFSTLLNFEHAEPKAETIGYTITKIKSWRN